MKLRTRLDVSSIQSSEVMKNLRYAEGHKACSV